MQLRQPDSRTRLLIAATELSAQHGFMRASSAEIGAAAGLSRGAVGFLFGSRASLSDAVLATGVSRWRSLIRPLVGLPSFGSVLDQHWYMLRANPIDAKLALMIVLEGLGTQSSVRPQVVALQQQLHGYVVGHLVRLETMHGQSARLQAFAQLIISSLLGLVGTGLIERETEVDSAYRAARATLTTRWAVLCADGRRERSASRNPQPRRPR